MFSGISKALARLRERTSRAPEIPYDGTVDTVLRIAGWEPGRRVDISKELQAIIEDGYKPHQACIDFLQEFTGLTISMRRPHLDTHLWITVHLDPIEHVTWEFPEKINEWYSVDANTQLIPIGGIRKGGFLVLIGEDGCLYEAFDEVHYVGRDLREYIKSYQIEDCWQIRRKLP